MLLARNCLKLYNYWLLGKICSRCTGSKASTIYSLSSGLGKCGVAIVRVSGPNAKYALSAIIDDQFKAKPRFAALKALRHPQSLEIIDKGLVLWFPGPASFTGEDCCEFQVHGSLAVISAMLDALGTLPDFRAAQPGEFTKRAFYNAKLDLTEVDGLADLIHAETEAQRKQALLQCSGYLSQIYEKWRQELIRCTAHMEAYIDFAEDENIEDDVLVNLTTKLEGIRKEISAHLDDRRQGELLRNGVRTAIVGAPNVGKSSFLNRMCQRKVSIVTPIAGTTRDIIETTMNFGGYPIVFADTAGLRHGTDDVIEIEGIARTRECVRNANLILLITDAMDLINNDILDDNNLAKYISQYLRNLGLDDERDNGIKMQLIVNKVDLLTPGQLQRMQSLKNPLLISCKEDYNIDGFLNSLHTILSDMCGEPSTENPRITHRRYREQLVRCHEHISEFLQDHYSNANADMAIAAQKLRHAVKCLEQITGHITTDDILDVVFREFCIGK